MKLASLLIKGSLPGRATAIPATFATVAPLRPPRVATVATVAVANHSPPASNDGAAPWRVTVAPGTPADVLARMRAASLALDKMQAAVPPDTPDAPCWPHSTAMTGAEIDLFTARLARFVDKGLDLDAGERLADKLVLRDREDDDRRICLECTHLHRANGWRCGNWQAAGIACRARDAQLPTHLATQLQRCDGFTAYDTSKPEGARR